MSDSLFTTLEGDYPQDSDAFSISAPTIGWSIALLCLVVLIRRQMKREQSLTDAISSKDTINQPSFTQALQWVSYAKELERNKQYEAAVSVYDQGLKQHPNDFRLWHERGLALAKLQNFEGALVSFNRAYELRPDNGDLAHERGDTLLQLGRFEEAIASFDIYLRYHPGNPHVLADRGYALSHLERFEEALVCLNQVLKTAKQDRTSLTQAHYCQIEVLRHLGQFDAALRSSQKAMKQYPDEHFETQHQFIRQQMTERIINQENHSDKNN